MEAMRAGRPHHIISFSVCSEERLENPGNRLLTYVGQSCLRQAVGVGALITTRVDRRATFEREFRTCMDCALDGTRYGCSRKMDRRREASLGVCAQWCWYVRADAWNAHSQSELGATEDE